MPDFQANEKILNNTNVIVWTQAELEKSSLLVAVRCWKTLRSTSSRFLDPWKLKLAAYAGNKEKKHLLCVHKYT